MLYQYEVTGRCSSIISGLPVFQTQRQFGALDYLHGGCTAIPAGEAKGMRCCDAGCGGCKPAGGRAARAAGGRAASVLKAAPEPESMLWSASAVGG